MAALKAYMKENKVSMATLNTEDITPGIYKEVLTIGETQKEGITIRIYEEQNKRVHEFKIIA